MAKLTISDADLLAELDTDPAGLGFKTAPVQVDGFKTTRRLRTLLSKSRKQANPVATVAKPLSSTGMRTEVGGASLAKIDSKGLLAFFAAVRAGNRDELRLMVDIAQAKGSISATEKTNLLANWIDATVASASQIPLEARVIERWGLASVSAEQIDRVLGR